MNWFVFGALNKFTSASGWTGSFSMWTDTPLSLRLTAEPLCFTRKSHKRKTKDLLWVPDWGHVLMSITASHWWGMKLRVHVLTIYSSSSARTDSDQEHIIVYRNSHRPVSHVTPIIQNPARTGCRTTQTFTFILIHIHVCTTIII